MSTTGIGMYIPNGFTFNQSEDLFKIVFSDNSPNLYAPPGLISKIEIIGKSIFHKMIETSTNSFYCSQCSAEIFTAMFGIASENKNAKEVLSPNQRKNPWIFEILQENLSFFYPSREFAKLLLMNFSNMELEDAHALASIETRELSFALVLAQKRIRDSIYFNNTEDFKEYSKKLDKCIGAYQEAKAKNLNPEERKKIFGNLQN